MFERLWLQGGKRRDTSWYREYFQRRRRHFSGATDPRGDFEHALRACSPSLHKQFSNRFSGQQILDHDSSPTVGARQAWSRTTKACAPKARGA